jgi:hypothetical protein
MKNTKLYQSILAEYPLVDYEQDRKENGHITLLTESERFDIVEGMTFAQRRYRVGNGRETDVYLVTIAPDAKVQLAASASPLRKVRMVKRHVAEFPGKVLFAMNAGFFHYFNGGDLTPYSIQVMHGAVFAEPGDKDKPWYTNHWVGSLKDGTPVIADADEYFNNYYGKVAYAVGGGLTLIRNGEITLHNDPDTDPRTAVAKAKDGTVILMCADGRSKRSAGLSYGDMIELYQGLGYEIETLLNLDGGGSTTVVLMDDEGKPYIKNVPSGPPIPLSYAKYDLFKPEPEGELMARAVSDCLLVIEK